MKNINVELTTEQIKKQKDHDYFQSYYAKNKELIAQKRKQRRMAQKKDIIAICQVCGKEFVKTGNQKYCSKECNSIAKQMRMNDEQAKEIARKYRQTEAYKRTRAKYARSEKGKQALKRYLESEKGKETMARYKQSERYKETLKRYQQSQKGKERSKRYVQSDKYKIVAKRYQDKLKAQAQALYSDTDLEP